MKKKIYNFFHPHNIIIILEFIFIILAMIYLTKYNKFDTTIGYILYLIMTLFFITICIKLFNILIKLINKLVNKNKYLKKYKEDHIFKYHVSLFICLILNIIYVLFKFIFGIYFNSLWLISFAIYYFILVVLRIRIAKVEFKNKKTIIDEYKCYKNTGIILLFINLFITIIILIIGSGHTLKQYNQIVAITVATYTFFLMTKSILSLIKYRKYKSPLMTSAKVISVVTSMISMLSLEIIMLSTFSPEETDFNKTMIMSTGGGIAIIIIVISIYMIINGKNNLCLYYDK